MSNPLESSQIETKGKTLEYSKSNQITGKANSKHTKEVICQRTLFGVPGRVNGRGVFDVKSALDISIICK